jgi:hypothetical protein
LGHITAIAVSDRTFRAAGALVCILLLGGCGGVELEGKVFDYMGVSGGGSKEADVRMGERPPLLVPPTTNSLPQPGTGAAVVTARQDWPDDPEKVRKRLATQEQAKQAELEAKVDPTNPYAGKPNLMDKLFGGSDEDEVAPIADVPEPDASDKVQTGDAVAQSGPRALTPHVPQAPLPAQEVAKPLSPDSYKGMSSPEGNQAGW